MSTGSVLVSIGMPVRNCQTTVSTAIRSVLNQTLSDWELLVVDDGSQDSTAQIAAAFRDSRIHVIADGFSAGLPARLNQLVRCARGRYFARMDGDDVCFPERLAIQAAYLEAHTEVDLVSTSVVVFGPHGKVLGVREVHESHRQICRRPWGSFPMPHPTWMGQLEWFRAHRYARTAVRCEDQELLLRTYEHSRFAGIAKVLLGYREDRLRLRKLCSGRLHYMCAVQRHFCERGQYGPAAAAIVGHCCRLAIDTFAITSGLQHTVLRHRARPAPADVVEQWHRVWALNAATEQLAVAAPEANQCVWHGQ